MLETTCVTWESWSLGACSSDVDLSSGESVLVIQVAHISLMFGLELLHCLFMLLLLLLLLLLQHRDSEES